MRKAAVILLFLLAPVAYPCGDKLSSANRGVRLQRAFASRPLSIVILSSPRLTELDSDSIRVGLARVGHRIEVAASLSELESMLTAAQRDIVLAAAEDVPAVENALAGARSLPAVVRILHMPANAEWRAETKRCPLVMRVPGNTIERLQAIDAAMRPHGGSTSQSCNTPNISSR